MWVAIFYESLEIFTRTENALKMLEVPETNGIVVKRPPWGAWVNRGVRRHPRLPCALP